MLRIAEAEDAGLIKADDAEQQTLAVVRRLGNDVLTEWAQKRIEQCNTEQKTKETATQSGKKLHWHSTFGQIDVIETVYRQPGQRLRPFSPLDNHRTHRDIIVSVVTA